MQEKYWGPILCQIVQSFYGEQQEIKSILHVENLPKTATRFKA